MCRCGCLSKARANQKSDKMSDPVEEGGMFSKKHSKPQNRIDTLIGVGTVIEGDMTFSGGLRIDGQVNGNVLATPGEPSTLVLSEHAKVNGVINGLVSVSDYLELQSKARVTGDVNYRTVEIQLGAVIEGRLIHSDVSAPEKIIAFKLNGVE